MSGRLAIVGLGPGSPDLVTPAAATELAAAELLIGYQGYLDQIPASLSSALRQPYLLGEERQRGRRAAEAAAHGQHVALVSSGDPGVYGMAALALQELALIVGEGPPPEVVVVPGVTAATAAAALVGAPLNVDFACVSLSDALVPRSEIEARVQALAATDIALVLYNPASRKRHAPWAATVRIVQEYRPAATPAAAIRRAFRAGQAVELTEVGRLHELAVDMETVVIVGSSRTRRTGNWLLTLREDGM